MRKLLSAAVLLSLLVAGTAVGQSTRIEVQLNGAGPTAFAPVATIFHDGSYNAFQVGDNLSGTGLEMLAETGGPAPFLATAPTSANTGTNGAPTGPGLSSSFTVDVDASNTQFNFASMVLFSNDWFVGNESTDVIDISSLLNGNIGDLLTIDLNEVYDAGTELEDYTGVGGSAFFPFVTSGSLGQDVTDGAASILDRSTNPYLNFTNVDNLDLQGFDPESLEGFTAPSLGNITLRVVAVPEPASATVLGLASLGCLIRRRRK